ncbi:MAG: sulfatase-like hydrolase/transferase [candidate division Zixibacteria bacterium]|nr:sulfatase-like hydrolase/transferase [candidate division Zixibacteria bacterium]
MMSFQQIKSSIIKFLNPDKQKFYPPNIVFYWIAVILWGLIYMSALRLMFLIRHWNYTNEIPAAEILYSFLYGVKYDFVIVGYIVLPVLLISILPFVGFERSRLTRKIFQPVLYALFAIAFLLVLIDIEYFGEFYEHLGVWFYIYLNTFDLVWYMIYESFPVIWYLIGWLLLSGIFIFIAQKFNWLFHQRQKSKPVLHLLYVVLLLAIVVAGIRGSLTLAPLDWATAYHSNHYFANELTLNGPYTLSRNVFEYNDDVSKHNPSKYHFVDSREALKTVQKLVVQPSDSLLEPERSLKRQKNVTGINRPPQNIVFIIMESWSASYIGSLGGSSSVSPCFDSLAEKGLLFENFYASGLRTNRGLLSVLCSFPSLPGRTVMKLYGSSHPFLSITEILDEYNYGSYFIYGGDIKFDNIGGFFRMKGFKNIISVDDFKSSDIASKWGVPDHIMFEKANSAFTESYPEPFIGVILTLSNHKPFAPLDKQFEIFPPKVKYADHLNVFYYSDWALGQFFKMAEKEKYFNNTIFVLVGDHGQILGHPNKILKNFRIASLIYCPGRDDIKPRRIKTVCGQCDLLPTALGLLNLPVIHESWGRDILTLDSTDDGFAFIDKGDTYGWIENSYLLWEKANVQTQLYQIDGDDINQIEMDDSLHELTEDMRHKGQAILQLEVEMVHNVGLKRD